MELYVQGRGPVRLEQSDFVAQGGQGKVYARGATAYKIYSDPSQMIPVAKIRELAILTRSEIVRPDEVLLDNRNRPVGYTMRRIQDAHPLCRLFTRTFRERQGVTEAQIAELVRRLRDVVAAIHDQGVLVVDMNEMNFLVEGNLTRIVAIDVDSYQTRSFPATVIADSIRDRHASHFSEATDWFAFAILTFQMFVGIHPYRGTHHTLTDLESRMKENVSVLNTAVARPTSCYPLAVIPDSYLAWYNQVFEQGARSAPPQSARIAPQRLQQIVRLAPSKRLTISPVLHLGGSDSGVAATVGPVTANRRQGQTADMAIVGVVDRQTVVTTEGVTVAGVQRFGWASVGAAEQRAVIVSPRLRRLVAAWRLGGEIRFWDVSTGRALPDALKGEGLLTAGGRLYVRQGAELYEILWLETSTAMRPMLRHMANLLPHAAQLFDGVVVQDIQGACHVSVFPETGICHSLRVRELDGRRTLDAKFDNRVLMVLSESDNTYLISILRFSESYRDYDVRSAAAAAAADLNFVTLDNGTALWLDSADSLQIFANCKDAAEIRILDEPALGGAPALQRWCRSSVRSLRKPLLDDAPLPGDLAIELLTRPVVQPCAA